MDRDASGNKASHGSATSTKDQQERRSSMDPVRDMTPLEEYQSHYDPVVTDRLIGQRVVKQHKVDTKRLGFKLDKLSRQQSLTDKQAEKERRIVQKELEALQLEPTGHGYGLPKHYGLPKDLSGLRLPKDLKQDALELKWPMDALPPRHSPETNYGRVRRSKSLR